MFFVLLLVQTSSFKKDFSAAAKTVKKSAVFTTLGALGLESLGVGVLVPAAGLAIGSSFFVAVAGTAAVVGAAAYCADKVVDSF